MVLLFFQNKYFGVISLNCLFHTSTPYSRIFIYLELTTLTFDKNANFILGIRILSNNIYKLYSFANGILKGQTWNMEQYFYLQTILRTE